MSGRTRQRVPWWRPTPLLASIGTAVLQAWRAGLPTVGVLRGGLGRDGRPGPVGAVAVGPRAQGRVRRTQLAGGGIR